VIGAVCEAAGPQDVVVNAAGSMPGDLHKLWKARDPKSYHVEYGYSCMGYEIPGGLGVKMAAPEREVFVLIGDGSYLMLPGELATAVEQGVKLTVVLVENHGYSSIGSLSRSIGSQEFGTKDPVERDLGANAESLGAKLLRASTIGDLRGALEQARAESGVVVIHVEVDRYEGVPQYESWWDVPVAEVSRMETVQAARAEYEEGRSSRRSHL
jgi:3D-(3,5/4)-trihydroxycyclohexane-1,2-dione acylhydrolase (decyclizing)